MKTTIVTDAFMMEHFYTKCFEKYPEYEIAHTLQFGSMDRGEMRDPIHLMELNGPDTLPAPQELLDVIEDTEILMVHMCPVNRPVIERAKNLKVILTNRGGIENIDLQCAAEHGIAVLNNPAHNANSVAELTVGLMLAETRNIARTHANMVKGVWQEHYNNVGAVYELRGRTIGIIGFGNIGRRVARKLQAFDCNLLVHDSWVSPEDPDLEKYGCKWVPLDELMANSDIVTLHLRGDERLLFEDDLRKMKKGAYFINTARTHLIDNDCIYDMLRSGHLMGAAFDVFTSEPLHPDHPLLTMDNVTMTNHRGGDTVNCYSDSPAMLLEECNRLLAGGEPKFFINKPHLEKLGVKLRLNEK